MKERFFQEVIMEAKKYPKDQADQTDQRKISIFQLNNKIR